MKKNKKKKKRKKRKKKKEKKSNTPSHKLAPGAGYNKAEKRKEQ